MERGKKKTKTEKGEGVVLNRPCRRKGRKEESGRSLPFCKAGEREKECVGVWVCERESGPVSCIGFAGRLCYAIATAQSGYGLKGGECCRAPAIERGRVWEQDADEASECE